MNRAIRALVWEILARHRWLVGGSAVWLLVACLIAALLPESVRNPNIVAVLLAPAMLGLILFLAAVTHGESTRLDTRAGEFPPRLLLLPVSVGTLAGVPLALALSVPSFVWMVAALGVLRPCGVPVAIFWPGLYFGVSMAWLLALSWSPMPLRWARLAITGVVAIAFFAGVGLLSEFAVPEYAILLGLVVMAALAVGLAVRGVSRSRCEGGDDSESAVVPPRCGDRVSIPQFRARRRAQLWLEWRTHGRPLLILASFLGLVFIVAVAMSEHLLRTQPYLFEVITSESLRRLGPAWIALTWLLVIPALMAGASGGEMGRFNSGAKVTGMPAFVGLLPITTTDLVRGKFIAAAIHLALMWGVFLTITLGWAIVGGHVSEMADRLSEVCGSPGLAWATLLATLASVYAISYLITVGSMWGGLFGSPLIAPLPALLGTLFVSLAVYVAHHWQPGYETALQRGLWLALGIKVLLAGYLVHYDRERFQLRASSLAGVLLAWAVLTAIPAGTVAWLIGEPTAALAVVVFAPLVSSLATPAILHRSRHGAWA